MALFGFSGTTPTLLFQTNIAWTAGSAHCVTLNYGTNSELYLDGQLSAIGAGTTPVPSGSAELTLGSAFDGGELAQAAFDELSISSRRMNAEQVAFYFGVLADQAALGPISPEEDAAHAAFLAARGSHSSQFSLLGSAFSISTLSSFPACDGSGPLLMTNIASTYVGTPRRCTRPCKPRSSETLPLWAKLHRANSSKERLRLTGNRSPTERWDWLMEL